MSCRSASLFPAFLCRVREVRNSCVELLRSWLESLDADVLALLRSLNVGGHREVCEKAIRAIWTHRCTADLRRILTERSGEPGREPPFFPGAEEEDGEDTVTPEQALYWRVRCAVAAEADDSELLDALLPNTARLCSLTENFVSDLKQSSDRQRDLEGKLDTLQSEDGSEMVSQLFGAPGFVLFLPFHPSSTLLPSSAVGQSEEELEVLDAQLEEVEVLILEGLYVVKEFLSLCHFADFQDEVGRRQLKALVGELAPEAILSSHEFPFFERLSPPLMFFLSLGMCVLGCVGGRMYDCRKHAVGCVLSAAARGARDAAPPPSLRRSE